MRVSLSGLLSKYCTCNLFFDQNNSQDLTGNFLVTVIRSLVQQTPEDGGPPEFCKNRKESRNKSRQYFTITPRI